MKSRYFEGLTGAVITPHDPGYEDARQEWNRAIQRYPVAIVYCSKKIDVSNAICWARKRRVGIRIRSRGHHYEGYSTGNCILVIDISKLQRVEINAVQGTVTVEGGVNNSQLYEALGAKGYSFPGGTCPTVGVTGYTLGGGWGYSSRLMGLGCDSLLELEEETLELSFPSPLSFRRRMKVLHWCSYIIPMPVGIRWWTLWKPGRNGWRAWTLSLLCLQAFIILLRIIQLFMAEAFILAVQRRQSLC